ncbi:bacteriocin immunity protein [Lactococcus petauri]|uniref:bacteriocin immunity protein n=1 Tax=Lactococcus petauri TaxID=1940789 RepID=UPI0022E1F064|nr:bacteriocin immunity protein [Lactococcus petauri]
MKKQNQKQFETELLDKINYLLSIDITPKESEALLLAKKQLETSTYLPRVISDLKMTLTPLAIKQTLTKEVSDFYRFINKSNSGNKNLGGGLISSWGPMF